MFIEIKLFPCYLAALKLRIVLPYHLKCKEIRPRGHDTARHDNRRKIRASDTHQQPWQPFVTGGNEDTCIERSRIVMDLNHIGNHIA